MAKKKRKSAYLERKQKQEMRRYKIGLSIGLPLFLLASPVYLLFTAFLYPAPNSGFLALGIAGAFIVGVGMLILCICLADIKDSSAFGTLLLCGAPLLLGVIMVIISCVIMYTPEIYDLLVENYITFYFTMWAFLLVLAILYAFARRGISHSQGISKTAIKSAMKGARNYWWYEELHNAHDLGVIYPMNKWFTCLYTAALFAHISVGWIKYIMPVIGLLLTVSSCFLLVLWFSAMDSIAEETNKHSHRNLNYIHILLYGVFILGICYATVLATVRLFR